METTPDESKLNIELEIISSIDIYTNGLSLTMKGVSRSVVCDGQIFLKECVKHANS